MTFIPILIKPKPRKGIRANVPAWLADPERPAPCYCGQPMRNGEPYILATGEFDLKRWFHASCWEAVMGDDDEWDEEDE